MPSFSSKSLEILSTCDSRLVDICNEVIKVMDISVLCGHRGEADQNAAITAGNSKLSFPQSKHNTDPAKAVDIAPYPISWTDREGFVLLAGFVTGIAHMKGYNIRWGGAWDGLSTMRTNKFDDLPHFEIVD